jgi:hypothetical protein
VNDKKEMRPELRIMGKSLICLIISLIVLVCGVVAAVGLGLIVAANTQHLGYSLATGITIMLAASRNMNDVSDKLMNFVLSDEEQELYEKIRREKKNDGR